MGDSIRSSIERTIPPTFMLKTEDLAAKAFNMLGLGTLPKGYISGESLRAIECIARVCLPIIGDHCRDIITIYEERSKSIEEEFESDAAERDIAALDIELDALRSEHKRLLAQREVHIATDAACHGAADVLNQAAQSLLNAAPLVAVAGFVEDHVHALKQVPIPLMTKPKGTEPISFSKMTRGLECVNDAARFSIQDSIRNHLYDYSDGDRGLKYLLEAFRDLKVHLEDAGAFHVDASRSSTLVNVLAHTHAIKNLASKVVKLDSYSENLTPIQIENILKQCLEIIKSRYNKLKEINIKGSADTNDNYELMKLRDRRSSAVLALAAQINDIESLEEDLRNLRDDLYTSQKLRSFESYLNVIRSQKSLLQSTKIHSILVPRGFRQTDQMSDSFLKLLGELELLADTIHAQGTELQPESKDNRAVLEYLATLERSVDTLRLTALSMPPSNVAESLVEELLNLCILRRANDVEQYLKDKSIFAFNRKLN
ncbi:hypothetical protein BIW11_12440 [Tropilaelaps mercedesae]|uniref:Uncharacterized protein n=1 Tax=Tropilaelaps mercedesae TaxID=418985 RepID=A0A1V9X6U9_9ACAR|nr:hypothetical protein BIW11_12440 [Tropilaelaps mercedesae]